MIYFDNSTTTYPKPANVTKAVYLAMVKYSFNSGRGGYKNSVDTSKKIFDTRNKLSELFSFEPQNVAFTPNCTYALNMAIKGCVNKGDHIIISNLEHNSVARVVHNLYMQDMITYDIAPFSYDKEETVNNFKQLINENTKMIVCIHSSNVFGCVFPIKEIGELARENNIIFIVDVAQSAGILDINMQRDNIDILCAPGHKGLYGPLGTGFIALNSIDVNSIIQGGTGSSSLNLVQPDFMPDKLESGTLNNIGIIGLGAGIDFVERKGIDKIYTHEMNMIRYLYDELSKNDNVVLYTPKPNFNEFVPIISFNYADYSSEKTANILAQKNIATRAGFHCSPLAHKSFGTYDRGTVRISPSIFNNDKECEVFINYLKNL